MLQRFTIGLLLAAGPTLAQNAGLGPVTLLPGDTALDAAAGIQAAPAVVAGAGGHLVVWEDLRTDFTSIGITTRFQTGFDVLAARLDASGNLIDTTPIVISQRYGDQRAPLVAWNGENWLVAWEDQSPTQFYYTTNVLAVRVAPDGTVLDDPPITVVDYASSTGVSATLTVNGTEWLVVSQADSAGLGGLIGRRVAADGTVLDPGGVTLVPATYYLYFGLKVVAAQGEYLLAYQASGAMKARRFTASLAPIGGELDLPTNRLASSGTGYFATWTSGGSLVGSPLSVSGALQFPAGVPIATTSGVQLSFGYGPAWDGAVWWIAWVRFADGPRVARVTASGSVLDPGGVGSFPGLAGHVRELAHAGAPPGGARLVWRDDRRGGGNAGDVYGLAFSASAVPGTDACVSLGAPTQRFSDVATGEGEHLVAFLSETSGSGRILVQRVDALGDPLDGEPIEVVSGTSLGAPRVAWNGALYMVVWYDSGSIFTRRLLANGTWVDAQPVPLTDGFAVDLAALGDVFLVVVTRATISSQFVHPFFVRVDGLTGLPLDPVPVALGQYFARAPRVTTFAGRWLATWQRNVSHDNPFAYVTAAFVEPNGTPRPELSLAVGGRPDVAVAGGTALLAWRTGTDSSSDHDVRASRLLPDGSVLDPAGFVVSAAPDKQNHPSVAWTGTEYLVAWEDQRGAATFFDERVDVYAARVDESGAVLDPGGFAVFDSELPAERPVLAVLRGQPLAFASLYRDEPPHAAYRVGARTVGGLGNGYCGPAVPNSTGVAATIAALGSTSAAANDLELVARDLPPGQFGYFLASITPGSFQPPGSSGVICLAGDIGRFNRPQQIVQGPAGTLAVDLASVPVNPPRPALAGETWLFQCWYRDTGSTSNFTAGLSVTLH